MDPLLKQLAEQKAVKHLRAAIREFDKRSNSPLPSRETRLMLSVLVTTLIILSVALSSIWLVDDNENHKQAVWETALDPAMPASLWPVCAVCFAWSLISHKDMPTAVCVPLFLCSVLFWVWLFEWFLKKLCSRKAGRVSL